MPLAERARQLLEAGSSRAALEAAKQLQRLAPGTESEALLIEAYLGRARALFSKQLATEAIALLELVARNHPGAREQAAELQLRFELRSGTLDVQLAPLARPDLPAAERAAIEERLRRELIDPGALARSSALPPDDPLRRAASATAAALEAVTRRPVSDAEIALGEVSRRSPLAPWKLLVRALAAFHRGDEELCRRTLASLASDSAPAPLGAQLLLLLDPARARESRLAQSVLGDATRLRSALERLDSATAHGQRSRVLKAIRECVAVAAAQAPELLAPLRQRLEVRGMLEGFDPAAVMSAMGGPAAHDAAFFQLLGRTMESEAHAPVAACAAWGRFQVEALRQGWFKDDSADSAAVYLHMAELLEPLDPDDLRDQRDRLGPLDGALRQPRAASEAAPLELDPATLLESAARCDPQPQTFARWLAAAQRAGNAKQVEAAAQAWHAALPDDARPLLELMRAAEQRGALRKALGYLERAEARSALDPGVRSARRRLQLRSGLRHIEQSKPQLLESDLAALEASAEGDAAGAALLCTALRWALAALRGEPEAASAREAQLADELHSPQAARLLLRTVAGRTLSRQFAESDAEKPRVPSSEADALLRGMGRVCGLARPLELALAIPTPLVASLIAALRQPTAAPLAPRELRALAETALDSQQLELVYAASGVGLRQAGPERGRFLLLRAASLALAEPSRSWRCLGGAIALGRRERDLELVAQAVEQRRNVAAFGDDEDDAPNDAQIEACIRAELEASRFPSRSRSRTRNPSRRVREHRGGCECAECELERVLGELPPAARRTLEETLDREFGRRDETDLGTLGAPDADEELEPLGVEEFLDGLTGLYPMHLRGLPSRLIGLLLEAAMKYGGRGGSLPPMREVAERNPELHARIEAVASEHIGELDAGTPRARRRRR